MALTHRFDGVSWYCTPDLSVPHAPRTLFECDRSWSGFLCSTECGRIFVELACHELRGVRRRLRVDMNLILILHAVT